MNNDKVRLDEREKNKLKQHSKPHIKERKGTRCGVEGRGQLAV